MHIHILQKHNIEDYDEVTEIIGAYQSENEAHSARERLIGDKKYMYFVTSSKLTSDLSEKVPTLQNRFARYLYEINHGNVVSFHDATTTSKLLLEFIASYFDAFSDEISFKSKDVANRLRGKS